MLSEPWDLETDYDGSTPPVVFDVEKWIWDCYRHFTAHLR
jgi:hypothetical protein